LVNRDAKFHQPRREYMSDDETPPETKPLSYPQKYWWVILVALPVALALIKLGPDLFSPKKDSGSSGGFNNQQSGNNNVAVSGNANILNSDLSTETYVINLPAIEKEYAAVKGEPLKDEELKKQIQAALDLLAAGKAAESAAAFALINRKISLPSLQTDLGVAYQKAGDTKAAMEQFSKALAQDPNYAPAHHNLGLVKTSRGELVEAQTHFEKSSDIGESKTFAKVIQQELKESNLELEPNNEPPQANILPLEKTVTANVTDGNDSDFFRITTPPKYRDVLQVRIENLSRTLKPSITVYDANKSAAHNAGNQLGTAGADLGYDFVVPPDTAFFVQVHGWGSTGRYTLTVKPLKKYDAYEPNDNIREPAAIDLAKEISANIMDGGDTDFYRFKTGSSGGTLKGHLENRSTTLKPGAFAYDGNKSSLGVNNGGSSLGNAGANLDFSFTVQPNAIYFVQVHGWGSNGDYTLALTQD
jgi:tetratricopeptide (TPR) repeat protein